MEKSYQESFYQMLHPCFMTTVTTVIGFLSLLSSDLTIIKRFGLAAAWGSLIEWFMIFFFLPAILQLMKEEKNWVDTSKAYRPVWLSRVQNCVLPKWLIFPCLGLMLLSLPSFLFLNDHDSPIENFPKGHALREANENFKQNFNWQGQTYLYFPEALPSSQLNSLLTQVSQLKGVVKIENPLALAEGWSRGTTGVRKELIERELSQTPLWDKYFSAHGSARIPLYLDRADLTTFKNLRLKVDQICDGLCRLAGQSMVYLEYGEKIAFTLIESFAVSILLVVIILTFLMWQLDKMRYFFPVVLSSLSGPLIMLSLMALFQVPVTLVTSVFLAVMVGLAGDNAIQYLLADEEQFAAGIDARARASVLNTLLMAIASSFFIFQTLCPMKILGVLFMVGFFVSMAGDLFGLKGLLPADDLSNKKIS